MARRLRQADGMDAAAAECELDRRQLHDLALGEDAGGDVVGALVGRPVFEGRDDDGAVWRIEIGVGKRKAPPFSIETLMSVAAAGAVAIGATEEAAVVIFLFAVGELLENVAAGRARAGRNLGLCEGTSAMKKGLDLGGMIDTAAARARRRSLCGRSRICWSLV